MFTLEDAKKKALETVELLKEGKLKIAVAESCTGGLIASLITDVPGASQVFECGIVAYSEDIKQQLLGVSKETLDSFGVVSRETAKEMASGLFRVSAAHICVSTTGIAGPDGGTEETPVGTVCTGFCIMGRVFAGELDLGAAGCRTREEVRLGAVCSVLDTVQSFIRE